MCHSSPVNAATQSRVPASLPSTEELENSRNGTQVKAKLCTFDDLNILPEEKKIATEDDCLELAGFEAAEEQEGRDPWRHVMDRLWEEQVMPVGTLHGTHNRIVVATLIDARTNECTSETIPRVLFFAFPIRARAKASGVGLCFLEDLIDKADVDGYAAYLLIRDLGEIDFTCPQGVDQPINLPKRCDSTMRTLQQIFGRGRESRAKQWAKQWALLRKGVKAEEDETEVLFDQSGKDLVTQAPKLVRRQFPEKHVQYHRNR